MDLLNINEPTYESIKKCHSSNVGENLLHGFGVETKNLDPKHYFIPWITFDKVSSTEEKLR